MQGRGLSVFIDVLLNPPLIVENFSKQTAKTDVLSKTMQMDLMTLKGKCRKCINHYKGHV